MSKADSKSSIKIYDPDFSTQNDYTFYQELMSVKEMIYFKNDNKSSLHQCRFMALTKSFQGILDCHNAHGLKKQ